MVGFDLEDGHFCGCGFWEESLAWLVDVSECISFDVAALDADSEAGNCREVSVAGRGCFGGREQPSPGNSGHQRGEFHQLGR